MRLTSACPSLRTSFAIAGLLAAALPAAAGDLSNGAAGGIKDYGSAGIPVPAPMPYEENFKWYLRGDIGTGFKHSGSIGNDGMTSSVTQPNDWHELSIISMGFGRYITPSLRAELTLDYRPERSIAKGSQSLGTSVQSARLADTSITLGASSVPAAQSGTNFYSGVQNEDITYQNTSLLMSGFYDFNRDGRLKPYIGAGIGLAVHQLHRQGTSTYTCYDGTITTTRYDNGASQTVDLGCNNQPAYGLTSSYSLSSKSSALGYGLAAQLSAGVSYDLTARTHWDTGYRMLWQSGRVTVLGQDGLSSLRINDRTDHEVRTGIRWDVW